MSEALIIFARYPRLGRVKTRLESSLDRRACLHLHEAFLDDTVRRTGPVAKHRFLYIADCSPGEARELVDRRGWDNLEIRIQHGRDLGERMFRAFEEVGRLYPRVVIMGSDSPTLPMQRVDEAFRALTRCPVVLGPSEDGGYYLLGLTAVRKALFEGIEWGGPSVLRQTIEALGSSEYTLLPPWYDVDLPRDLSRLARDLEHPFEGFPEKTKQLLDSWSGDAP